MELFRKNTDYYGDNTAYELCAEYLGEAKFRCHFLHCRKISKAYTHYYRKAGTAETGDAEKLQQG